MNETNNVENAENQAALYDLIQSIQSKINVDETNNQNNNQENNSQEQEKVEINNNGNNSNNIDLSAILNNFDFSSFLGNNNSNNDNDNNSFNFSDIDPKTMLKLQKIISNFSKKDPKKDLLRSLKPFLRKSRQDKIGEYMTILTLVDALDIFGSKGSD